MNVHFRRRVLSEQKIDGHNCNFYGVILGTLDEPFSKIMFVK